jgi:hypothetical protein
MIDETGQLKILIIFGVQNCFCYIDRYSIFYRAKDNFLNVFITDGLNEFLSSVNVGAKFQHHLYIVTLSVIT